MHSVRTPIKSKTKQGSLRKSFEGYRRKAILLRWGRLIVLILSIVLLSNQPVLYSQNEKKEGTPPKGLSQKKEVFVDLDRLIKEARERNPYLKAAYRAYLAADERIAQSVSLEDPKASFGYFFENAETRVGPQIAKYGISQKFPFFGKLTLKGRIAERDRDIAYEHYKAAVREVVKELKHAYFDLYWVRKSINITKEVKTLLETLEQVAESKYSTGIASQQDVLKAQVEISKLMDKLLVLGQQEVTLTEKLNTLLNRPVESPIAQIKDFGLTKFDYSLEKLFGLAKRERQELKALSFNIKKYKAIHSLKKKDWFPDFTLGVDFIDVGSGHTSMYNDGQDAWMATAKINLPIWRKRIGSGIKEAEDRLEASQQSYQNMENQVLFQIKDFYFRLTTAGNLVNLYKTALIPQAGESFKAAMASYETGKTDFLNIIDSERVLLNFKIAYFKSVSDYEKAIADLERAVGQGLSDPGKGSK